MDFELTKAQKDIQKAARKFAKGEFDHELAMELEHKHEFPAEICKKAGELGFIGLHFPTEYGGQGYGCLENVLVVEEFCRQDSSIGSAALLCGFASETVATTSNEGPVRPEIHAVSGRLWVEWVDAPGEIAWTTEESGGGFGPLRFESFESAMEREIFVRAKIRHEATAGPTVE